MMNIFTKQITLTGTAIALSTPTEFATAERATRVFFQPDSANTHVVNVLNGSAVIKQLAKPSAADAILDDFDIDTKGGVNVISTGALKVNGTNGEKVNVTIFVG